MYSTSRSILWQSWSSAQGLDSYQEGPLSRAFIGTSQDYAPSNSHSVTASSTTRECLVALVAHSALRRISNLLGPRLVIAPNVSVLIALAFCIGPVAVFFRAHSMGERGVTSKGGQAACLQGT